MPEARGLVDEGMQIERTALSWQRTSLVGVAGACVLARWAMETWGTIGLLLGAVAAVPAAAAAVVGARRYRHANRTLRESGQLGSGAVPGLLLATCVVGLGLGVLYAAIRTAAAALG